MNPDLRLESKINNSLGQIGWHRFYVATGRNVWKLQQQRRFFQNSGFKTKNTKNVVLGLVDTWTSTRHLRNLKTLHGHWVWETARPMMFYHKCWEKRRESIIIIIIVTAGAWIVSDGKCLLYKAVCLNISVLFNFHSSCCTFFSLSLLASLLFGPHLFKKKKGKKINKWKKKIHWLLAFQEHFPLSEAASVVRCQSDPRGCFPSRVYLWIFFWGVSLAAFQASPPFFHCIITGVLCLPISQQPNFYLCCHYLAPSSRQWYNEFR